MMLSASDPRHGKYAGYHAHKRLGEQPCLPCREAKRRYNRLANMGKTGRRVSAHAVRRHVIWLLEGGMSVGEVRLRAGVAQKTIRTILDDVDKRIQIGTAKAILAVPLPDPEERDAPPLAPCYLRRFGAARRLQALVAIGYTIAELAPMVGLTSSGVALIVHPSNPANRGRSGQYVLATTWHRVDEVYRRLHMRPVPDSTKSRHARTVARRNGWVPPLAWDDIDDPAEVPDPETVSWEVAS